MITLSDKSSLLSNQANKKKPKKVNLFLYASDLSPANASVLKDVRYSGYIFERVSGWSDYTKCLKKYPEIGNLTIFCHGSSGAFWLDSGDDSWDAAVVAGKAMENGKPIARVYATICFEGCDVFSSLDKTTGKDTKTPLPDIRKAVAPLNAANVCGFALLHGMKYYKIPKGASVSEAMAVAEKNFSSWKPYWIEYVTSPKLTVSSLSTKLTNDTVLLIEWFEKFDNGFPQFDKSKDSHLYSYADVKTNGCFSTYPARSPIIEELPAK